jgi:hypothetical protein
VGPFLGFYREEGEEGEIGGRREEEIDSLFIPLLLISPSSPSSL